MAHCRLPDEEQHEATTRNAAKPDNAELKGQEDTTARWFHMS
jgi:hypothetical protein